MWDRFYWLALTALAVWRVTHALSQEDGPWDLLVRLRRAVEGTMAAKLLDCFYCLSVWVALPFALWIGMGLREKFLLWLATSAGAILLERATAEREPTQAAPYFEHQGENEDVVLRER